LDEGVPQSEAQKSLRDEMGRRSLNSSQKSLSCAQPINYYLRLADGNALVVQPNVQLQPVPSLLL